MGYPTTSTGLVFVTHAGTPVEHTDAFTFAMAESLRGEIEQSIEPFVERIRALGGYVLVDIPLGFGDADVEVHGLPDDLTAQILDCI